MEEHRGWHFGFNNHYDLCIYDLAPGQRFSWLYDAVHNV